MEWIAIFDKNSNSVKEFKIEFDDATNNGKEKYLKEHFWEKLDELLYRIWSVHRYCNNNVYVLSKNSFYFLFFCKVDLRRE